jgi:DNA mismatch repair protein MutS2
VKLDDLVGLPERPAAGRREFGAGRRPSAARAEKMAAAALSAPEARCDVRGLRAEDAVREIELFLDRAYSEGPSQLLIVHGHGTGALKRSIREALEASPYVASFRGGERHEGGDGVTVVDLRS